MVCLFFFWITSTVLQRDRTNSMDCTTWCNGPQHTSQLWSMGGSTRQLAKGPSHSRLMSLWLETLQILFAVIFILRIKSLTVGIYNVPRYFSYRVMSKIDTRSDNFHTRATCSLEGCLQESDNEITKPLVWNESLIIWRTNVNEY